MTGAGSIRMRRRVSACAGMRERVEALGGRYTIESGADRGTCLRILIPLRAAPLQLPTSAMARGHDGMTSVLIVDDHPIVLQGCRRILEDAGVETVIDARDVASGYRAYRRHHPDVVIVDLAIARQGPRRAAAGAPHSLARPAHAHPGLQHAQRSDHRRARARGRGDWLCAQGHLARTSCSRRSRRCAAGTPYLSAATWPCRWRWCAPALHRNPLDGSDPAGAGDVVAAGRRQALRPDRRAAQGQLQDRGQYRLRSSSRSSTPATFPS